MRYERRTIQRRPIARHSIRALVISAMAMTVALAACGSDTDGPRELSVETIQLPDGLTRGWVVTENSAWLALNSDDGSVALAVDTETRAVETIELPMENTDVLLEAGGSVWFMGGPAAERVLVAVDISTRVPTTVRTCGCQSAATDGDLIVLSDDSGRIVSLDATTFEEVASSNSEFDQLQLGAVVDGTVWGVQDFTAAVRIDPRTATVISETSLPLPASDDVHFPYSELYDDGTVVYAYGRAGVAELNRTNGEFNSVLTETAVGPGMARVQDELWLSHPDSGLIVLDLLSGSTARIEADQAIFPIAVDDRVLTSGGNDKRPWPIQIFDVRTQAVVAQVDNGRVANSGVVIAGEIWFAPGESTDDTIKIIDVADIQSTG